MSFLVVLAVMVILLVVPLKFAATWLGAGKTGFSSCLMALILAGLLQIGLGKFLPYLDENVAQLISLPLSGVAYMLVLDTTFLKAIGIALVQMALMTILLYLFAGAALIVV